MADEKPYTVMLSDSEAGAIKRWLRETGVPSTAEARRDRATVFEVIRRLGNEIKRSMRKLPSIALAALLLASPAFAATITNAPGTNAPGVVTNTIAVSVGLPTTNAPIVLSPGQATTASNPWVILLGVAVPLLIALIKSEIPKLPNWLLPIIAPALGVAADYLLSLTGVNAGGPLLGAAYGLAGVGLREIKDQVQKKMADSAAGRPSPTVAQAAESSPKVNTPLTPTPVDPTVTVPPVGKT